MTGSGEPTEHLPGEPPADGGDSSRPSAARRVLRGGWIVVTNVVVLVALLLFTNLASGMLLAHPGTLGPVARLVGREVPPPVSAYVDLPVYTDKDLARTIWREFDESRTFEYAPFVEWRRKPYSGATVHVDAEGDRFSPEAPAPPVGAPVVRLFGGSSMWGTGVTDAETIPATLQRLRPSVRVLNHGESEFNTRQNLERLVNLLSRGRRVDVAVFYEGFNDVLTLCRRDVDLNGHGEEPRMRSVLERSGSVGDLLFGRTLTLLAKTLSSQRDDFACDVDPSRARAVATTVANEWRLARTLLAARGVELIVVLQPVAAVGTPELGYFDDVETPGEPSPDKALSRQLRAVYPLWQKLAATSGNQWLHDFSGLLDGAPPTYIDHVHLSAQGNARVASELAPLVDAALERRSRHPSGR